MEVLKKPLHIDRVMSGIFAKKLRDEMSMSTPPRDPLEEAGAAGHGKKRRSQVRAYRDKSAFELLEEDAMDAYERLRKDPEYFVHLLEQDLPLYDEKNVLRNNEKRRSVITSEGKKAVEEAIRALQDWALETRTSGKKPRRVFYDENLSKAARQHAADIGRRGTQGHRSVRRPEDGRRTSASERIDQYDAWIGAFAECISYAESTGEAIIKQLLIDDGVPSRGNRKLLLSRHDYGLVGFGCAVHYQYRFCCVLCFADELEQRKRKEQLAIDRALERTAAEASKVEFAAERERQKKAAFGVGTKISQVEKHSTEQAYLPAVISDAFVTHNVLDSKTRLARLKQ
ncbi:unnamed protein product [Amoebophrya sp. A120]|nr:unnamed protein product [Amoebophrya sp. A120]|eukprot:GSA120T00004815001.1